MKRIALVLSLVVICMTINAQFVQKGKTLEYNGNNPKTPYTDVVVLDFTGAASTFNNGGVFELNFNLLKQGEMIRPFVIKIRNNNYVLFNKTSLQQWILTPDLDMEIILCDKKRIDNTVAVYTENNMRAIKAKYKLALKQIDDMQLSQEELEEEKRKIEEYYLSLISELKARAIVFAYVDETKLDSIELLKRYYMLTGNIDSALILGRKAEYSKAANELIRDCETINHEYKNKLEQLSNMAIYVSQHIDNLKIQLDSYWYSNDVLKKEIGENYKILVDIYSYLLEQFENRLRCEEFFLNELKTEYGKALYGYAMYGCNYVEQDLYLEKSASYNNTYAMFILGDRNEDFYKAKEWFEKCLNTSTDDVLSDKAQERLESFPDFLYIAPNKDSIYCHILEDGKSVTISDYHPYKAWEELQIPSIVTNKKGKNRKGKYIVRKIGYCAFRRVCANDWSNSPFVHHNYEGELDDYYWGGEVENNGFDRYKFNKVVLPNTIVSIGRKAFFYQSVSDIHFPNSLRIIKDEAFRNCELLDSVYIPEGVEEIGIFSFWDNDFEYNKVLYLPSTLKKINEKSFVPGILDRIYLNPNNPYFRMIDGALFSADSSIAYEYLWPNSLTSLFIPDKCTEYCDLDSLKCFRVSASHPLYSVYEDVLYSKDMGTIICVPRQIEVLKLSPQWKGQCDGVFPLHEQLHRFQKLKHIIISEDLDDTIKYHIIKECFVPSWSWASNKYDIICSDRPISVIDLQNIVNRIGHKLDERTLSMDGKSCLENDSTEQIGVSLLSLAITLYSDEYAKYSLDEYYDNRKAFEETKKAADNGDTEAMNLIAYKYALGKGTKQSYDNALLYIDKAIDAAPDVANYWDSKGEIFLMKGDDKNALIMWRKVVELEPNFATKYNSNLHKQLLKKHLIRK